MSDPAEFVEVESEHEEEETIALLPDELREFQQLEHNSRPTGEHLQFASGSCNPYLTFTFCIQA